MILQSGAGVTGQTAMDTIASVAVVATKSDTECVDSIGRIFIHLFTLGHAARGTVSHM